MDPEIQGKWMEHQITALVERAASNGVGAYVIYGQLVAAAAGVGNELDDELKQEIHKEIEKEMDTALGDVLED